MRLLLITLLLLGIFILGIVAIVEVNEDDPLYADGEAIAIVQDWVHKGDNSSSYGAQVLAQTTDGLWREDYLGHGKWLVSRAISWKTNDVTESDEGSNPKTEIEERLGEYTYDLSDEDRQSFQEGLWEGYSKPLSLLQQPDIEWFVYEKTGLVVLKSPLSPDDILAKAQESTMAALFLAGSFQIGIDQKVNAFNIPGIGMQIKSLNVYLEPSDLDQAEGNMTLMDQDAVTDFSLVILDKKGCINGINWSDYRTVQPWFTVSEEDFLNALWDKFIWITLENPGVKTISYSDMIDNLEGLPGEEINEVPCYHLRGDIEPGSLPYLSEEADIDLWIGVQDFAFRQVELSTESTDIMLTQKFNYSDEELIIEPCKVN